MKLSNNFAYVIYSLKNLVTNVIEKKGPFKHVSGLGNLTKPMKRIGRLVETVAALKRVSVACRPATVIACRSDSRSTRVKRKIEKEKEWNGSLERDGGPR